MTDGTRGSTPALGYHVLTPWYDRLVATTTRERTFKRALLDPVASIAVVNNAELSGVAEKVRNHLRAAVVPCRQLSWRGQPCFGRLAEGCCRPLKHAFHNGLLPTRIRSEASHSKAVATSTKM